MTGEDQIQQQLNIKIKELEQIKKAEKDQFTLSESKAEEDSATICRKVHKFTVISFHLTRENQRYKLQTKASILQNQLNSQNALQLKQNKNNHSRHSEIVSFLDEANQLHNQLES